MDAWVLVVGGKVLLVGPLAVSGVGNQCQHLRILHRYHRSSSSPRLQTVSLVHGEDGLFQGLLHRGLIVNVDGEGHGLAGLRVLGVDLTGDLTLLVGIDQTAPVQAAEIGLKGLLHPVPAHHVVHLVVAEAGGVLAGLPGRVIGGVEGVPLLGPVEFAHTAKDVGSVVGVIDPTGLPANNGALKAAVVEDRNELHGDIPGEDIAVDIYQLPELQLVEDPQHLAGLLIGQVLIQVEVLPHQLQQLRGGDDLIGEVQLPAEGGDSRRVQGLRRQLVLRPFPVRQILLEPGSLGIPNLRGGVGEGRSGGNGEIVLPGHAVIPTQPNQPEHRPAHAPLMGDLRVRIRRDLGGVEGDGIDLLVGHQDLPVPVGDDAPGGLHSLLMGYLGSGSAEIVLVVNHLGLIQKSGEGEHGQDEHHQQKTQTAVKSLGIFQRGPPLWQISSPRRTAGGSPGTGAEPPAGPEE